MHRNECRNFCKPNATAILNEEASFLDSVHCTRDRYGPLFIFPFSKAQCFKWRVFPVIDKGAVGSQSPFSHDHLVFSYPV